MDTRPIGVLDSGVGGLTVLKEIMTELPQESVVYIGDSKNAPYGKRTPENIQELAGRLIQFLHKKDVKLIVVACNTITVNGIEKLRQAFPQTPIIGTVPVIKTAATLTRKKKIGVLATETTAKSSYNNRLIQEFAADCVVTTVGTNKLVPLIETENTKLLPSVVKAELQPFKKAGIDVLVLGCTHFPILREQIAKALGKEVLILDSGGAIARQVRRILTNNNELSASSKVQRILYTTGSQKPFAKIAKLILGKSAFVTEQVVLQ